MMIRGFRLLLLVAVACCRACAMRVPAPPRQSAYQRQLMRRISEEARRGSVAAGSALLFAFGDEGFRSRLTQLLPESSEWSAPQLLNRFRGELAVSEIIHNLPARSSPSINPVDVDLGILSQTTFLMNQWELAFLEPNRTDPGTLAEWMAPQDATETGLYGMVPFSGHDPLRLGGRWPASFDEAAQRPVYNSLNFMRVDMGVAEFGPLGLVFRRRFVENMTVVSPVDTGDFEDMCNGTFTHSLCSEVGAEKELCGKLWFCAWSDDGFCDSMQRVLAKSGQFASPGCDKWDGTPGTLSDYDHLILANVNFWNRTDSNRSRSEVLNWRDNLALQVARLLSPWNSETLPRAREAFHEHYWEANVLGTPLFPDAVLLVLGDFSVLFGTDDGMRLQALCNKWGWALVWALGPNLNRIVDEGSTYTGNYTFAGNKRLLDPLALAAGKAGGTASAACNMSEIGKRSADIFQQHWDRIDAARKAREANTSYPFPAPRELEQWWSALAQELGASLRVEPLRAASCADVQRCFGVNWAGDCVCYDTCVPEEASVFV